LSQNFKKYSYFFILIIIVGGVFIGLKTPLFSILAYRINPDIPNYNSHNLDLENIDSPVNVYFDEYGVPHIEANSMTDAARVTGYLQWRERGWQMDLMRHFASGRMSELVGDQPAGGKTTVELDRAMRAWNLLSRTPKGYEDLNKFDASVMRAFIDGLNQAQKEILPIEHKILGITPAPWTINDIYLVSLIQAWSLSHNWEQELVRFSLALQMGEKRASAVYPHEPLTKSTTIKTTKVKKNKAKFKLPPAIVSELQSFVDGLPLKNFEMKSTMLPDLMEWRPAASNAWVVNGERTKSGKPIVANDMHMTHTLPSLLFLIHIKTPNYDVHGVTLPGLPLPVSGHNADVSWGITSAVADVMDLVIEKLDPDSPGFVLHDNRKCKLNKREEVIKVKDGEDQKIELWESCHGFVLNTAYPGLFPQNAPLVALKWNTHSLGSILSTLYKAGQSRNIFDLQKAMQKITIPPQNITAADSSGNIAFFTMGKIPYRKNYRGTFPIPGWLEKYEWTEYSRNEDLPTLINPDEGIIVNTNNLIRDPHSSPLLVQIDSGPDYRYNRTYRLLNEKEFINFKDMERIQGDVVTDRANVVMDAILSDLPSTAIARGHVKMLKSWDFAASAESTEMALFATIYREAILLGLNRNVDKEVSKLFLRQRYSTNVVDAWFESSFHPIWDDPKTEVREKRREVIGEAYAKAITFLAQTLGSDESNWTWGNLHYHRPTHLFGKKAVLDFMNLDEVKLGGSLDSVWKAHFNMALTDTPFKTVAGPAYRFVSDLADIKNSAYGLDTGESGVPLSPHYGDQFSSWQEAKVLKSPSDWKVIKENYSSRHLIVQ